MILTNAQINRKAANQLFAAGFAAEDIATEFPRVFHCSQHRLGLHYSDAATKSLHRSDSLAALNGLKETDTVVTQSAVDRLIEQRSAEVKTKRLETGRYQVLFRGNAMPFVVVGGSKRWQICYGGKTISAGHTTKRHASLVAVSCRHQVSKFAESDQKL